jgi:hypothetical protein
MVSECFVPWSANRLLSWSLQYVQFREPVVTDFSFLGEPSTSRRQSLSFMQLRNEGDKDQRPTPALPCPASLLDGMLTKMLDFYLHECSCKQSCQITAAWSCNVTFKRPNQSTTLTHLGAYIYICILSIASVNPGSSDSMPQENFVPILPAMVDTQYWAPWKLHKDPIIQLI